MPRKKIELPPRAVIHAKLTATTLNGMPSIEVHGLGGPLTGFVARKNGVEFSLPGATIANVSPGIHYVAWDGESFVLRPTLESILEYDNLTLIGQVEVPAMGSVKVGYGRPPLDSLTCEAIDQLLHRVDERHWPTITAMRVKKYYPPDSPVPPQAPKQLLNTIQWYASMVFGTEADQYDQFRPDVRYPAWLSRLAERTIERVVAAVEKLNGGDPEALLVDYHGLRTKEIEESLKAMLWEIGKQYEQGIAPSQRKNNAPSAAASAPTKSETARIFTLAQESVADQIQKLLAKCNMTKEEMAEALAVNVRQVYRHCAGQTQPRPKHRALYQRLFTEKLGEPVILRTSVKTSGKRHEDS